MADPSYHVIEGFPPAWRLRSQCDHWFSRQLPLSRVTASQRPVCIRQYSLKNHGGEPVVASGYFVDSVCVCESECWCTSALHVWVFVYIWCWFSGVSVSYFFQSLSSIQCLLSACVTVCLYSTCIRLYASAHSGRSFTWMLSPVFCVFISWMFVLILCLCNTLLHPSVASFLPACVFSLWMGLFVCVWVNVCEWMCVWLYV